MEVINKQSVTRNSSFELLRLILMFLIVVHHGVVHGLDLTGLMYSGGDDLVARPEHVWLFSVVNCFCIPAVNVFVLISGYFKLKPTLKKVLKLSTAMLLYTLVFNTSGYAYHDGIAKALTSLLIFSNSHYWFLIDYLFLMCIAPMINQFSETVTKRDFTIVIAAMLTISCYFGFIWGHAANSNGYTLFQFMTMYSIGRYIRRFDVDLVRGKVILTWAICGLLCGSLMYCFYRFGHNPLAWKMTSYNNPLIIISAIAIFLLFKSIEFSSTIINKLATSALAIYLFQSSGVGGYFYYKTVRMLYVDSELGGVLCW